MAIGDAAAAAGLHTASGTTQSVNKGAENHNRRGDELAEHIKNGTHPWAKVTGKPSTFPPAAHSHSWDSVTGKPSSFPPAGHTHSASAITSGVLTRPVASPGDLSAEGTVYAAGRVRSPGTRAWAVVSNYASVYADGDGWFGITPSAERFKRDIRPVDDLDPDALLGIVPVYYQLTEDPPEAAPRIGFIAERLVEAGLSAMVPRQVTPGAEDYGQPLTINYETYTVALQLLVRHLATQLDQLAARVTTLEGAQPDA